jgi:hypothetical protein
MDYGSGKNLALVIILFISRWSCNRDNFYVNTLAGIPCIVIIDFKPSGKSGFVPYWQ